MLKTFNDFIAEPPQEKDWIFGSDKIKGEVLQEDSNWGEFLPSVEIQHNRRFDTYACTNFSGLNCLETLYKRKYGDIANKSDRFSAKTSGTIPGRGNSLRNVAEAFRKAGVVDEDVWPFTEEMGKTEYFAEIPQNIKDLGLKWLQDVNFNWEWVSTAWNADLAWGALRESPLHTAVWSGSPTRNGLITKEGFPGYDHAVMIYGGEYKKKWLVFNSYENSLLEYAWDYPFFTPIKYHLTKINIDPNMKFNFLRDTTPGDNKIYLIDSDGVKHHINAPSTFKRIFGKTDWDAQRWTNVSPEYLAQYPTGDQINLDKLTIIDLLKEIINRFGSALGLNKN